MLPSNGRALCACGGLDATGRPGRCGTSGADLRGGAATAGGRDVRGDAAGLAGAAGRPWFAGGHDWGAGTADAPVQRVHQRLPVELATVSRGRMVTVADRGGPSGTVDGARVPVQPALVQRVPLRQPIRLGVNVLGAVRRRGVSGGDR